MTNVIKKIYKNGTEYDIYATGGAEGAVSGPSSAADGHLAVFDGTTGKLIKDGGAVPSTSDCVKTSGNQTIAGTKTFSTSPVVPSKSTAAGNNATTIATEAQVYLKQDKLTAQTAYTTKGSATKVPQITTNTLGQVTAISEVTITQPTVNDATLTIQKNGTNVNTFTANASSNVTANIQVNEVPSTGTTGHVLTKTENSYEWAVPSGGASDHLEEKALVGELYTLNDKLFKQRTPSLSDSTLDCNVSNTNDNKQIHIQRLGSGVTSNQLKLKVKKVGNPTQNLKVEVRKGVQVTVTEGVEAYWYGNQVIASGSIAYSSITTNYAEYTVTLNANFGGTKGELLDIVVYMDAVNASNYYCIACDSTQYSEGFSYVSVNGNTRTRNLLMPYGISDGFAQYMLCKNVDSIKATSSDTGNARYVTTSGNLGFKGIEYIKPLLPEYPTIKATVYLKSYNTEYNTSTHELYPLSVLNSNTNMSLIDLNGMYLSDLPLTKTQDLTGDYWFNKTYLSETMTVKYYCSMGSSRDLPFDLDFTREIINTLKSGETKVSPQDVCSIGDLAPCITFGLKPNGEREYGPLENKSEFSSSATTGSITPGNYVGYVTIEAKDGTIYKVGVYNV